MSALRRTCREVTRLVLEGQDRRLSATERVALRLHWLACDGCSRFRRQVEVMRGAEAIVGFFFFNDWVLAAEIEVPRRAFPLGRDNDKRQVARRRVGRHG